jgi:hypothetical protein
MSELLSEQASSKGSGSKADKDALKLEKQKVKVLKKAL